MERIKEILARMSSMYQDDTIRFGLYYVIAIFMGILCGAAAALLKGGITIVTNLLFSTLSIHEGNWAFWLLPIVGIFIATLYTKFVTRLPMDHGTERIADDLVKDTPRMSPKLILDPIITCSFTLGMGGSAGAESPIAYSGAAIGSNIGKALKLPDLSIANLVGCGAAAGIAGIYMAPIGGVMYALEVLHMRQSLASVLALSFSSLAAALTCYVLLGCHTDVTFVPSMRFDNSLIPYVLVCGLVCGAYSVYYRIMISKFRHLFGKVTNIWLKALMGGAMLAAMLFLFPSLYGEGYGTIGKLMDNDPLSCVAYSLLYNLGKDYAVLLLLLAVLLILKPIATAATNDSGGVGGSFTPTLFCGAVLGFLFAAVAHYYFHIELPYALFAFFGMAAVMSGAKLAPLMGIFITAEMTGLYGFILPLTIAGLTSFITTTLINKLPLTAYFTK